MSYGYCYDDSGAVCSGRAQQGTRNLRAVCDERISEVGDLGIYNCRPKRTSSRLSLHAEGRAWDAAFDPAYNVFGNKLAWFFVATAQLLGIQRVIVFDKEWDARPNERYWEPYTGPYHGNHVHVELCWASAQTLSREQVGMALDKWWEDTVRSDDMYVLHPSGDIWHIVGERRIKIDSGKHWDTLVKYGARVIRVPADDELWTYFSPASEVPR